MTSTPISNNHFSHDQQLVDALDWMDANHPDEMESILGEFPEIDRLAFEGSWVDTEKMGVDQEWAMWLTDAVENTGLVIWEDGEPWIEE